MRLRASTLIVCSGLIHFCIGAVGIDPVAPTPAAAAVLSDSGNAQPASAPGTASEPRIVQARMDDVAFDEGLSCSVGLGDVIWVDVANLDQWLKTSGEGAGSAASQQQRRIADLILYFNGVPLPGIHPDAISTDSYTFDPAEGRVKLHHLRFLLIRDDKSRGAWSRLLAYPVPKRRIGVSVGFENSEPLPTEVTRWSEEAKRMAFLVILPRGWSILAVILFLAALASFWWLCRYTDIVRDPNAVRRPDGRRPFSLARVQMAFWFFLVSAAYFLLWIITSDKDTVTTSVVVLTGISAATALGAAVVDIAKPVEITGRNLPAVDTKQPRAMIVFSLQEKKRAVQAELDELMARLKDVPAGDVAILGPLEKERDQLAQQLDDIDRQVEYFTWPAWKGLVYDLLGENNIISIHRFQIAVWTLILGVIFCATVYRELAMPDFSAALLGLLGISGGAYVGFKVPQPRP